MKESHNRLEKDAQAFTYALTVDLVGWTRVWGVVKSLIGGSEDRPITLTLRCVAFRYLLEENIELKL